MYTDIARSSTAWGGTNFQSIVDEIVRIRKTRPNIPLSDYPTTILVVSDMQFNPATSWNDRYSTERTNYEAMKEKLSLVFPKDFVESMKFVWWNVHGRRTTDMPATLDDGGNYFISGFDGSIVTLLLGGDAQVVDQTTGEKRTPTMEELIEIAMNQEVLSLVKF
jgi:hypothetical protein